MVTNRHVSPVITGNIQWAAVDSAWSQQQSVTRTVPKGLPWWSSGYDSVLPMQGAWVLFLVWELEPTCATECLHVATKDPSCGN